MPSLRYVAHLRAPGLDVIGAGEPALPGISIGHNDKAAFGLTIFPIDQEDLYVYRTKPGDPDCYAYGDGFERMRIVEERVAVKGYPDQTLTLKFTRHGPVVHEDRARNLAYGIRTVWLEPGSAPYLVEPRLSGRVVGRSLRAGAAKLVGAFDQSDLCRRERQDRLDAGLQGARSQEL